MVNVLPKAAILFFTLMALTLMLGVPVLAAMPLPPDLGFQQRQNDTLRALAAKFEDRRYGDGDYVRFGKNANSLVAKFALWDRGIADPNALDPANSVALGYLENLADNALSHLGTYDGKNVTHGSWSWKTIGLPGGMHAAMSFGFILHEWGDQLPESLKEKMRQALQETSWGFECSAAGDYGVFMNGKVSINIGELLAGEYFGYDSVLWQRGVTNFNRVYENEVQVGTVETNSPIYSLYHYPPLILAQVLQDETIRTKARIMLEYELAFVGHLYLPGGSPGNPRGRDRAGGATHSTSLGELYNVYFGDSLVGALSESFHAIGAASPWQPPEVLRSIFLDKGDGYLFWGYANAPNERGRIGMGYYQLAPQGRNVNPWEAVIMPGGDVMMGFSYGTRWQSIFVSWGVSARDNKGSFQNLYQYHPWNVNDKTQMNWRLGAASSTEIEDFLDEGYARQRMRYERTLLQIWDPTGFINEETAVHLPNWDQHGGEMVTGGGWYVGRVGSTYIAFRPLGEISTNEQRDGGSWTFLELPGQSGSVVELATTDQFATVEDYLEDLKGRYLQFHPGTPYYVEFDALDPDTMEKVRIKLQYAPERRFVNGEEYTVADLDRGLLDSPFVKFDRENFVMTLQREGYDTVIYDWPNGTITVEPSDSPRLTVTKPAYGSTISGRQPVELETKNIKATDRVVIKVDGDLLYDEQSLPSPGQVGIDTEKLAEGEHYLTATVFPSEADKVEIATIFKVNKMRVVQPVDGDEVKGPLPLEIASQDLAAQSIQVRIDDSVIYEGERPPSTASVDFNTRRLLDGLHQLVVSATDKYGHKVERSIGFYADNWQVYTDEIMPPEDTGWFGVIDRSLTADASDGWSYGQKPTLLFEDQGRKVRSADTHEYLVWEAQNLYDATIQVYSTAKAVAASVKLEVSADNVTWQDVKYNVELAASEGGWQKFVLTTEAVEDLGANWFRVTLQAFAPADELQVGRVELRLLAK